MWRRFILSVFALALLPVVCAAEPYPLKPIRIILGFSPGGSADILVRAMQPLLERSLGQPIIIENRTGAGGVIALETVVKAQPDGHVIGIGAAGALSVNVNLNETLPYDPVKDLAPVSLLAVVPLVLIAPASYEGNSVRDVVMFARTRPLSIGHGGNGTAMHLTAQLFNQATGIGATLVPYRGSTPLAADVLAGHVTLGVTDLTSALPLIGAGQVKALAVTSAHRAATLPNVPTLAERQMPGFAAVGWFGVVAPAGTRPEIVAILDGALASALSDPTIKERIAAIGAEPAPGGPAQFAAFIRSEIDKWSSVIAKSGAKGN